MAHYQQVPFWDFVRSFDNYGPGAEHAAGGFAFFGPPGVPGSHPGRTGFSGCAPNASGAHCGEGRGRAPRSGPHEQGSQSGTPNSETPEDQAREGSPHRDGHQGHRGHHGRRGGCGRGAWGGYGRGHHGATPFGGPGGFDLNALIESLSAHPIAEVLRNFTEQATQRSGETGAPQPSSENDFVPAIDIFSTETDYVLHIALPGAKKEDVGLNFDPEKGELNIAGVVYRPGDEEFLKTLGQSERKVGVFERTVKIPPTGQEKEEVDGDAITAKMEDGVLIVTIPKVEKEWTDIKRVDIE